MLLAVMKTGKPIIKRDRVSMKAVRLEKLLVTLISHEDQGTCASMMALSFEDVGRELPLSNDPLVPGKAYMVDRSLSGEFVLTTSHFHPKKSSIYLENKLNAAKPDMSDWRAAGVIIIGKGIDGKYYPFCIWSDIDKWLKTGDSKLKLRLLFKIQVGLLVA